MSRWKASGLHLLLSIVILGSIAGVLIWRWYPPGLFHMAQADKLLFLLAIVDVFIGPFLTLIVYRHGKKTLKFDLAVIAGIQLAALVYGLHTVWESRPVYLVDSGKYFDLVFANEIDPADLAAARPEFRQLPMLGPRSVGIVVPTDPKEREKALALALAGKDMQFVPANYRPHETVVGTLIANAAPLESTLKKLSAADQDIVSSAVSASGLPFSRVKLVPIYSSRGSASVLVDMQARRIMRPLAVEIAPQ